MLDIANLGCSPTTLCRLPQVALLGMALYPEVQKKAQAEIDAVIGPNRLPDFHDRPPMPYINAVVRELSCWNLISPLARPFFLINVATLLMSPKALPHMSPSIMNIMASISERDNCDRKCMVSMTT